MAITTKLQIILMKIIKAQKIKIIIIQEQIQYLIQTEIKTLFMNQKIGKRIMMSIITKLKIRIQPK